MRTAVIGALALFLAGPVSAHPGHGWGYSIINLTLLIFVCVVASLMYRRN